MRKVGALLDRLPGRLLVQWVPHGYGRRSMNLEFCTWLAGRHEEMDLMVHEPGFGLWEGGLRHHAAALVHRAMLFILLKKATRVWVSTAAWEARLRPYLFGRRIGIEWAPVPSNIPVCGARGSEDIPICYFGQYDAAGVRTVTELLNLVPERVALVGRGAELVPRHDRAIAIGAASVEDLSRIITSSRVMCHHYVDGVSGRRTTAMASLAHGKAVATVYGRFTEPVWRSSGAVALSPVGDAAALAGNIRTLLADAAARERMGAAGALLYKERFCLEHTIRQLLG
jgi:glycosyltransferase involved in cell wall biosynthesis